MKLFRNNKTGDIYRLAQHVNVKQGKEWVDGVVYRRVWSSVTYVRTLVDFLEKFTEVTDEKSTERP